MEIIFVLIPLGLVLLALAIWAFFWATNNGQFDDLDSPAYSIFNEGQIATPKSVEQKPENSRNQT